MSKAQDETIVIPNDALQEALKKSINYMQIWSDKELNALKQMCYENWKPRLGYKAMAALLNKYARDHALPLRTPRQIRNKLEYIRLKDIKNIPEKK